MWSVVVEILCWVLWYTPRDPVRTKKSLPKFQQYYIKKKKTNWRGCFFFKFIITRTERNSGQKKKDLQTCFVLRDLYH